ETQASLEEIVAKLPLVGLEVEGVEDPAADLAPFRVAYVQEAKQHPNADRLRVCTVEHAGGVSQVVCGAPNVKTGMYGIFAPPGSVVPGTGLKLKPGKIRGEQSDGMLVSEREMELSDEHDGIIELEGEQTIGTPLAKLLRLDDPVIEIAITPNHAEALGVRGIARDLAAAGLGQLKPFDPPKIAGSFDSPIAWHIEPGEAANYCPAVAGRYFRGVKNGESPAWLKRRLEAIGLRPISALVDITNYVTFDLNRPLHVFDADKVTGNVTMRMARDDEEILALDGRTYPLDTETLVIADTEVTEAIGGIMGGQASGCTEETVNVFLEVAYFDPIHVARTGRRLDLGSDARYRFERGIDPQSLIWGVEVASAMILEFCSGEASHPTLAGSIPDPQQSVILRYKRVESLGGVALAKDRQIEILQALGFGVDDAGEYATCRIPGWRPDIDGEADLVEEVLRIEGYDKVPLTPLPRESYLPQAVLTASQRRRTQVRQTLAWRGLEEVITFSFMDGRQAELFGGVPESLRLINPISSELDVMRPSVLGNLAAALQRNADRGYPDLGLFELGPIYRDDTPVGEPWLASGLRHGLMVERRWQGDSRPVDAFDAKADVLAVLEMLGAPTENLRTSLDAPAWYHPGQSGQLRLGPKVLARFGTLHPKVAASYDLKGAAAGFEIFLDHIPLPKSKAKAPPEISAFQPLERDLAFIVDRDLPAESLLRAARGSERGLLSEVRLFDLYDGKGMAENEKSLAITVTLQPKTGTLTDGEIEAVVAKVIAAVGKSTGGRLRR
ncbi:MAG: phenylalanine--tRNA ligase subunit beta, partial [Rhodospirillales bacterium]|nr:phenylalanine--tRNA ligase subunit beta [Rhodospirillales bacterium]